METKNKNKKPSELDVHHKHSVICVWFVDIGDMWNHMTCATGILNNVFPIWGYWLLGSAGNKTSVTKVPKEDRYYISNCERHLILHSDLGLRYTCKVFHVGVKFGVFVSFLYSFARNDQKNVSKNHKSLNLV